MGPFVDNTRFWTGEMVASGAATYTFPSANFLFGHPFLIPRNMEVSGISIEVNTSQASSNVRVGLYETGDANGFPSALIVESASFDTSTTGNKTTAITTNLHGPRIYWVAVVTNDAAVALEASTGPVGFNLGFATIGTNAASNAIQISHTFGALPDPFGAFSFDNTQDALPRIYLTVA